jgi:hypothetical protein
MFMQIRLYSGPILNCLNSSQCQLQKTRIYPFTAVLDVQHVDGVFRVILFLLHLTVISTYDVRF